MTRSDREEGTRWLRQASSDFEGIAALRAAGKHDLACFLAQQAAEKALKAYLYARGVDLVHTHSVASLCETCARYDTAFSALRRRIKHLDTYYVEARYPNALPDSLPCEFFDEADSATASLYAAEALEAVRKALEGPEAAVPEEGGGASLPK